MRVVVHVFNFDQSCVCMAPNHSVHYLKALNGVRSRPCNVIERNSMSKHLVTLEKEREREIRIPLNLRLRIINLTLAQLATQWWGCSSPYVYEIRKRWGMFVNVHRRSHNSTFTDSTLSMFAFNIFKVQAKRMIYIPAHLDRAHVKDDSPSPLNHHLLPFMGFHSSPQVFICRGFSKDSLIPNLIYDSLALFTHSLSSPQFASSH